MVAEIIGYISTVVIMLLLTFAFIYWVKYGGFKEFMNGLYNDSEANRMQCRKELKAYKKALKEFYTIIELKNLEIEELTQKQKEKKYEKDN